MNPPYPKDPYCNAPHPDYIEPVEVVAFDGSKQMIDAPSVHCRRMKDHDGKHSAFTFLVSRPETWATSSTTGEGVTQ